MKYLPLRPLLACLLLALPAFAAEETSAKALPPPPLLSFDFAGGTFSQLVTQLNNTPGGSINIIGDPEEMKTMVPAFSLRNAQPTVLGNALNTYLDSHGLALISSNIPGVAANQQVYTLRRMRPPPGRPGNLDNFESIQLAPFLEHQKVDDIVGAIRAGWELDPTHDAGALRIKYHPATTILLVSGPEAATKLATKIVSTLKKSDDHLYAPGQKPDPKPTEKR